MNNLKLFAFTVLVIAHCSSNTKNNPPALTESETKGCSDTLKSKWATYEKLNTLIAQKKFGSIPILFSKKYRKSAEDGIRDYREFWIKAWTLNHIKAMSHRARIKKSPELMVCEEGEWKINEK